MVASRNTVYDFIDRTMRNLERGEELAQENPHNFFEVTQLVNSTLGLLFFPTEEMFERIPETPIQEILKDTSSPRIIHQDNNRRFDTLRSAMKTLRNCFAHYNIEFDNTNNVIVGMYLWNYPEPKAESPDFVCYILVEDLRKIVKRSVNELKKGGTAISGKDKIADLEKRLCKNVRLSNSTKFSDMNGT